MKKALMLLCLSLASFSYVAAQHVAQGKVVDADGNPIPGVKVEIKGSTVSTLTELDGTFELQSETPFKKVRLMYSGMQPKVATVKPNQVIKMSENNWWTSKADKYSWIISPQVVFSERKISHPSFGLMVARVKEFGYYGKVAYSPGEDYVDSGFSSSTWSSNKNKSSYISATAGFVYQIMYPIHVYLGAGYVKYQALFPMQDGSYYKYEGDSYSGVQLDYGLILRLNRFALNGGVLMHCGDSKIYYSVNLGIGYSF